MESLKLKKVVFNPTEIILLRKKSNVIIDINNISKISYIKPNLKNFFLAGLLGSYPEGPGILTIWVKTKISKNNFFQINIRYKNILKLPDVYQKMIYESFL